MDGLRVFPRFGLSFRKWRSNKNKGAGHAGRKRAAQQFGLPLFELTPLEQRIFLSFAPSISGAPVALGGQDYTLNLNSTGTTTPVQWSINWGNGSQTINTTASTITHTYPNAAQTYTITATAKNSANVSTAAQPLGLDTTFNVTGQLTKDFTANSDGGYATAIQSDGKIVVAGVYNNADFVVARYRSDGTLDTSFGTNGQGWITLDFSGNGTSTDKAYAVAIDGNGKIVVAGTTNAGGTTGFDFAIARILPDGSALDTDPNSGFGAVQGNGNRLGYRTLNFSGTSNDQINAMAIQNDGKIVVAGYSGSSFAIARYTTSGSLDTTFNASGSLPGTRVVTVPGQSGFTMTEACQAVLLETVSGVQKIVLGGYITGTASGCSFTDFGLARLNSDGSLDDGSIHDSNPADRFGTNGYVSTDFAGSCCGITNDDSDFTLVLETDNNVQKIVAAGSTTPQNSSNHDFAVARYSFDGILDTDSGTGFGPVSGSTRKGKVTIDFNGGDDVAYASAAQSDGKILLAGYATGSSTYGTGQDFAIVRLNHDGALDSTFGNGGKLTTDFGTSSSGVSTDAARSMCLTSDGRILLAGYAQVGTNMQFAVARYQPTNQVTVYSVAGVAVSATEGQQFTTSVATISGGNAIYPYTATINWGDGVIDSTDPNSTTHPVTITANGDGTYSVSGTHKYSAEGSYTVTTTIFVGSSANGASITSTAKVADAPLTAVGLTVPVGLGHPFTGAVAAFTDASADASAAEFTATVTMPDGSHPAAAVAANTAGGGGFVVNVSNVTIPTTGGNILVQINDAGGASASAVSTIGVPLKITGDEHGNEGSTVHLGADASPGVDTTGAVWSVIKDGTSVAGGTGTDFSFVPDRPGKYVVSLIAPGSGSAAPLSTSKTVTVLNVAPSVSLFAGSPAVVGGHAAVFGSKVSDPGGQSDPLSYAWSVTKENDSTFSLPPSLATSLATFAFTPPQLPANQTTSDVYDVTLTVTDRDGAPTTATIKQTVVPSTATNNSVSTITQDFGPDGGGFAAATNALVQPDGKLLVAGVLSSAMHATDNTPRVFLARYNQDLSLDTTFGDLDAGHPGLRKGWAESDVRFRLPPFEQTGVVENHGVPLLLLDDGRIVIGGDTVLSPSESLKSTATLAMYHPDGTVDKSFGTQGYAYAPFDQWGGRFDAVAYQPPRAAGDQAMLVAAGAYHPNDVALDGIDPADSPPTQVAVARFTMSGALDADPTTGFGADHSGQVHFSMESPPQSVIGRPQTATALLALPDGSIVVGADSMNYQNTDQWNGDAFGLAKLDHNGVLATTFGPDHTGKVLTTIIASDGNAVSTGVALGNLLPGPDGKILAVGATEGATGGVVVARYNADGSLDNGDANDSTPADTPFGDAPSGWSHRTGMAVISVADSVGYDGASGTLDSDGRIIISGGSGVTQEGAPHPILTAVRLTAGGALDTSFGASGILNMPIAQIDGQLGYVTNTVAVAGDGTIYAIGGVGTGGTDQQWVAITRYDPGTGSAKNLIATARADGPVDLTWVDQAGQADGFRIERSLDDNPQHFTPIGRVGPHVTTFRDTKVDQRTTYYYRVIAFDQNGDRTPSDPAHATTAWANAHWVLVDTVPVNVDGSETHSFASLSAGQPYLLRASGNIQIRGSDPGIPNTSFRADAEYGHFNPLPVNNSTWVGHGLVDYGIGVNDTNLGMTKFPYWGPPSTDSTYTIQFRPTTSGTVSFNFHDDWYADNVQDDANQPLQVQIYRQIPPPPTELTATTDRNAQSVTLSWKDSGDAETQLTLERSVNGGAWGPVTILAGGTTTYVDTSVSFNTLYKYRVVSSDGAGDTGTSNEATAFLANEPPLVVVSPIIAFGPNYTVSGTVNATDPAGGAVHYDVQNPSPLEQVTIDHDTGLLGGTVSAFYTGPDGQLEPITSTYVMVTVTGPHGASTTVPLRIKIAASNGNAPGVLLSGPSSISGTSASLTATAQENGSVAGLTYHWSWLSYTPSTSILSSAPMGDPTPPSFSANDSPDASTPTLTFGQVGKYTIGVTVTDAAGLSTTTSMDIDVLPTLTSLDIDSDGLILPAQSHWQFHATPQDQFGDPMKNVAIGWSIDGANNVIDSSGMASLNAAPGNFYTVTASGEGTTVSKGQKVGIATGQNQGPTIAQPAKATVDDPATTSSGQVTISLSALGADDFGESNLTYSWELVSGPANATATFSANNGTNSAKRLSAVVSAPDAQTPYVFRVTVKDAVPGSTPATSTVSIVADVTRRATELTLSPAGGLLAPGKSLPLTVNVFDQFGAGFTVSNPDTAFVWSVDGTVINGATSSSYTYPGTSTPGVHTVQVSYTPASGPTLTASATVEVTTSAAPVVKIVTPQPGGDQSVQSSLPIGIVGTSTRKARRRTCGMTTPPWPECSAA